MIWSTFLGGSHSDYAYAISVETSGVVTVAGYTRSTDFPTTNGAYDTTHGGYSDVFVSRLSMGVPLRADVHALTQARGGTQTLTRTR